MSYTTSKSGTASRFSPLLALSLISAALAVNSIIGQKFSPAPNPPSTRRWYRRLEKPAFTPPGAAFAAAWTAIELGLAYGGCRLMRRRSSTSRNGALILWGVNMAMIGGWSASFFGGKATGASALASAGMIGTATGYAAAASRTDRVAAATAIPFIAWLGFATLLAEEVWRRTTNQVQTNDNSTANAKVA